MARKEFRVDFVTFLDTETEVHLHSCNPKDGRFGVITSSARSDVRSNSRAGAAVQAALHAPVPAGPVATRVLAQTTALQLPCLSSYGNARLPSWSTDGSL